MATSEPGRATPPNSAMLPPMGISPEDLAAHLSSKAYGRTCRHLDETDSTNDDAARWLADGGPTGLLVTASRQRAGRGTKGRRWSSLEAGDIYASLGLRLQPAPTALGAVALATGVALAEGIEALVPSLQGHIDLKWPNDLQVQGRKLAGILCESRWGGASVDLVIGFGINVARTSFEDEIAASATSLSVLEGGSTPSPSRLLAQICGALESRCEAYFSGGFEAIRSLYEARCVTLGGHVTVPVTRPDGSAERIHVRAERLDTDGALMVRSLGGGDLFRVDQADVVEVPGT